MACTGRRRVAVDTTSRGNQDARLITVRPAGWLAKGVSFVTMSMTSVLSATLPGNFPNKSARRGAATRSQHKLYDEALPKDHANVHVRPLRLQYWYHGKNLQSLEDAFITRNALRYLKLLRVCVWVLVIANIALVAYDIMRFKDDEDTMKLLIIIRFTVITPATLAMIAYTYSKWYLEHSNWLALPCFVFGAGMVAYSVIGDDPGYGTLALMVVFCYSFTPISFFVASALSGVLIVGFVTLLFLTSDKPNDELFTVTGMLALFWAAVAFVGHNLERSLRVSFLDEVVVRRQRDQLGVEKRLSDRLLANMLPKQIAAELKEGRHVVADEFEAVTVLFCEICNWGEITDQISADSVVTILNRIYSRFDRLIEKCNVYKVETVGEVYMVVGGCPTRTDTHATDCVNMALAMMNAMPALRKECEKLVGILGRTLTIRIGLNSGPIVAGIVGIKNPRYKLFGDTVNTASRMESTSEHGRIQVSDRTYPYIADKFHLTARGPIAVKGKGMMHTYFVDGPMTASGRVVSPSSNPTKASAVMTAEAAEPPLRKAHSSMNRLSAEDSESKRDSTSSDRSFRPTLANTPDSAEFWSGNGAAAAQAARELYAPTPDLGDKQHLVDLFNRHQDSDFHVSDTEDDAGINSSAFTITYGEDGNETPRPGQAPVGNGPLGGGPNDSRRIPSLTINQRAASNDLDVSDMRVVDVESRGSFSHQPVAGVETKATPMLEEAPQTGPTRTFSGNTRMGTVPPVRHVSSSQLTKLVSVEAPPHNRQPSTASIPPTTLGLSQPARRGSHVATSLSGVWAIARSLPQEAGRAVCLYRRADTHIGSMEDYFQKEYQPQWRTFMRISCLLCIIALGLFAVQDVFKFDRDMDKERKRHDAIMFIRYAALVPLIALYLLLTRLQKFKAPPSESYALVQALSVAILLLVGAGIIAVSIVGTEPGFGVLAAYIVFCFNITLIAYAFRAVALAMLIVAHMVCIFTVSELRGFELMEQLGYLLVFYLGQGLPVLGREFYNRENFLRRQKLAVQKKQLELETERTDRLLENLLPRAIARQLKDGAKCIAGHFDMATILFTDMRGFTNFSSRITPTQLVGFLNVMYSKFDMIATKYGIHKVEIIGDAYFSVAGCPSAMPDHAERCAAAALEMLEWMPELRRLAGADITMRVGIHTGPLVAGVVGVRDPRYHLFGNTVNLAMAMESNGIPSKVHISSQAHAWLQRRFREARDNPKIHDKLQSLAGEVAFHFVPREPMTILGHEVQTYILSRKYAQNNLPGSSTLHATGYSHD